MSLNEGLYLIAYCTFLVGASKSFRDNGSSVSVCIMLCGIILDVAVSMLPLAGVQSLKMNADGSNTLIMAAVALGVFVWLLFIAALLLRRSGSLARYHALITAVEVLWFIDYLMFLYGVYTVPLQ